LVTGCRSPFACPLWFLFVMGSSSCRKGELRASPVRSHRTAPMQRARLHPHPRNMPSRAQRLRRQSITLPLDRFRARQGRYARASRTGRVRQERASPSRRSHENVGTGRNRARVPAPARPRKPLTGAWFRRHPRRSAGRHEACLWRERRNRPQDEGCRTRTKEKEGGGRTWERCLANLSARQHRRPFSPPRSAPGIPGLLESGPTSDPPAAPAPRSRMEPGAACAAVSRPNPPRPGSHR
jgi:hypothetical protein